eukprot:366458-Chlamydomonas_euryale.AAC.27
MKTTLVHALVIAAIESMHPACWQPTEGLSLSIRVGASCGTACVKKQHKKPKACQAKTATAASYEGASPAAGRRRGRPPGSKKRPRICHAVMFAEGYGAGSGQGLMT